MARGEARDEQPPLTIFGARVTDRRRILTVVPIGPLESTGAYDSRPALEGIGGGTR